MMTERSDEMRKDRRAAVVAMLFALLCAGAATAQDVTFYSPLTSFGPLSQQTVYRVGVDAVSANVQFQACQDFLGTIPNVDAAVQVVAVGGGELDQIEVGRVNVSSIPSCLACSAFSCTPTVLPIQIDGVHNGLAFDDWVTDYLGDSFDLMLRIVLDPDDVILETDEEDNETDQPGAFDLIPLTGRLQFGSTTTDLGAVTAATGPGVCGSDEVELLGGDTSWDPSPGPEWNPISVPVAGICTSVQNGAGTGFDLVASSGSASSGSIAGEAGGFSVDLADATLDSSGAHPVGPLSISLPDGHSVHLPNSVGAPTARGSADVSLPNVALGSTNDFSTLTADSTTSLWIRSHGMPFFFQVESFFFGSTQFVTSYSDVRWAYDQNFVAADLRNLSLRGPTSNDVRFSRPAASQSQNQITIEPSGMSGQVSFDSGQGATHFPRLEHQFDASIVAFSDGRIVDGANAGFTESYAFSQSADCGGCDAGSAATADRPFNVSTSTSQWIGNDGAVMTALFGLGNDPAWGPRVFDGTGMRNRFQRVFDSSVGAMLYVPGFEARSTGGAGEVPVFEYLLGMREALPSGAPGAVHLVSSTPARRGNEFGPGFTLGPQTYRNSSGATEVGLGFDPIGTATEIAFGAPGAIDVQTAISSPGTKYILRPGGMTGVFNTETYDAPDPNVYGYALDLRRFAFRMVLNELDPDTWIDGQIDLPGKAGFGISFASLDLGCGGDLDGGIIVRELCDGTDNNGNGVVDDNCDESLRAWRTNYDLVSMDFVPTDPAEPACEPGDRELGVVSNIDVFALGQSMGLNARWSPSGEPIGAQLTGDDEQELDRPISPLDSSEDLGFMVALNDSLQMRSLNDDVGWFETTGAITLPFWEAVDVKLRLENASTATPDQTIVVKKDYPLASGTNGDILMATQDDESSYVSAEYTWGSTGYRIPSNALPLYYEPARFASKRPRFLGRDNELFDVVVADLRAGVNFADPESTKVSFGASADFQKLTALDIDLNIDLSSDDSIAEIDAFLNSISVPGTPTASLVGEIKSKSNLVNAVVDAALDGFLEDAVTAAVGAIDLNPITEAIGTVESIPELMASVVADELGDLVDRVVDPLSTPLEIAAQDLYTNLPGLLIDANGGSPNLSALEASLAQLKDAERALTSVESALGDVAVGVDEAERVFNGAFGETTAMVAAAEGEIMNLMSALGPVTDLTECGPSNPLRTQISEVQTRIDDFVGVLDDVGLQNWASVIDSVIGVDLSAIASAERDIRDLAEDLSVRMGDAQSDLNSVLGGCGSISYTSVLADANTFLASLNMELSQISDAMTDLRNELVNGSNLFGLVRSEVGAARGQVAQVRGLIEELRIATQDAILGVPSVGFDFYASPAEFQAGLDERMLLLTDDAFQWSYPVPGHTFVVELASLVREPVDQAVADVAAEIQIQLGALGTLLPHPSPEELEAYLVDLIMNSPVVESIDTFTQQFLSEVTEDLNLVSLLVFDQLNSALQDLFERLEGAANEAILAATAPISDLPLASAKIDGYALISGDELQRMHIGAEFKMLGDDDSSSSQFEAALDVSSWSANGKAEGCVVDGSAFLDAVISTRNLPIEIGSSDILIKKLYLGFTIENRNPVGVFGGIDTEGAISFEAFEIYDVAFHSGVGTQEVYLGAAAGAVLDSIQLDVAFLVGKTCNLEVLQSLDPQVAEFIEIPGGKFNGAFVRGSASIPIISGGCFLTVGVGADAGAWLLVDSPLTIGGVVGGAAYGEALCIASLRGQVTAFGQKSGDNYSFQGTGFGVAGLGFDCDPATWTSVARSRNDDWCGTGDAEFSIRYQDGWDYDPPSTSSIH